eukprot:GEMP01047884.1.p1 GENE.GEMP01047884.1~~GEMP01047884.1.p1  ORF type:complete len:326 (+),score=75.97 GEMP01047884.1:98-1075(+)
MAFRDSIQVEAQSGVLRSHLHSPTDYSDSDLQELLAEAKKLSLNYEEELVQRKMHRLHPHYTTESQWTKLQYPNDYTKSQYFNDYTTSQFPSDYARPQWTIAPTSSTASTADHENYYSYPLAGGLKDAAEPVVGKIYHAQLFERGQRLLQRLVGEEDQQRSQLQGGLAALVGPPVTDSTSSSLTTSPTPNTAPPRVIPPDAQHTTLRAEAPPFVCTKSPIITPKSTTDWLRPPTPSEVPITGLASHVSARGRAPLPAQGPATSKVQEEATSKEEVAGHFSDAREKEYVNLVELPVDLDFLDLLEDVDSDDSDDDEEILFNSHTIL